MNPNLKKILDFRETRDWKQFHEPKNIAISLALEAAEVLEIFQWTKDNKVPKDKEERLEEELADVYYWLLLISHDLDIDLERALSKKMKINEKRYSVSKSKGNSKKYTEL